MIESALSELGTVFSQVTDPRKARKQGKPNYLLSRTSFRGLRGRMVVAHRRKGNQGFVGRERFQQIVALPHAATSETAPSRTARLLHHFRAQGDPSRGRIDIWMWLLMGQ